LVTDLPADFEVFGQAVATSMADLLGGTTGQVLAKASNTNMDFTWVAQDDSNAIQNAIVDAKGDLIGATAADTPARLAVGTNGQVLTADSTAATGLAWATPATAPTSYGFTAGKNKVINGNLDIWQRGTSFTNPANLSYTADRIGIYFDGSGATRTVSQQSNVGAIGTLSPNYFIRFAHSVAGTGASNNLWYTRLENVDTYAGQTVTFSIYAKAAATTVLPQISIDQVFGSGGSASVTTVVATSVSVTTSWVRYSYSVAIPSISGKTVGTSSYVGLEVRMPLNATFTLDFSQIQLEAGSTTTDFQTATGTIQGELAACERYYQITSGFMATGESATGVSGAINFRVQMRTAPSLAASAVIGITDTSTADFTQSAASATIVTSRASTTGLQFSCTNFTGLTTNRPYVSIQTGKLITSAEL
jgi:hypothetical protein